MTTNNDENQTASESTPRLPPNFGNTVVAASATNNANWKPVLIQQAQNTLSNALASIEDVTVSVTPLGQSDLLYSMEVKRSPGSAPIRAQFRTDDPDDAKQAESMPLHHVLLGKAITHLIRSSFTPQIPNAPLIRSGNGGNN